MCVNTVFYNGATPMTLAAEQGHLDSADMLIKRGVDVDLCDKNGKTALMIAEERGDKKMVELLKANRSGMRQRHDESIQK